MPDGALSRHADWARRWVPFALGLVAIGMATKSETPVDHPFGNANSRDEPGAMQAARAMEAGRGRSALAPWAIPWRGWKDILWRTYAQILEDRLFSLAGGVVFYAILALFPAVTAVVSLFGLFSKGSAISDTLSAVATIIPGDAVGIINDQVIRVAATSGAKLSFGFVLGIAFALWSANAGTKAVMDALNVVYEETEKRGLIKLNVVSLGFTAGAIVAVLLALGFVVLFPVALAGIGLGTFTRRSSVSSAGRHSSFSSWPGSGPTGTDPAGGSRDGSGSASGASLQACYGCSDRFCSPGICPVSLTITPPTGPLEPSSE